MTKWEYLFEHIASPDVQRSGCEVLANRLGHEGWELVHVSGEGDMVFRRKKQHPIPVRIGPTEHKEVPYV